MKKIFLTFAVSLLSIGAMAKEITPMHVVEKASYQISGLVTKGKIDASYLTDISTLTVSKDETGYKVIMQSPSADEKNPNRLEIPFDLNAKAGVATAQFNSKYPQGPVFTGANAAVLLDLGAEAIVDHLSAAADNIVIARTTIAVDLQKEATGVAMAAHLNDGRTYFIHMDENGQVLSQGF